MIRQTVEVIVEQRDIDAGSRFNSTGCPIAIAAREQGLRSVSMNISGRLRVIALRGYSNRYLSVDAGRWANRFDMMKPVKPQTFVFEIATQGRGL